MSTHALNVFAGIALLRITIWLLAGCGLLRILRAGAPAGRHLVCASVLAGAIAIPLLSLLPAAYSVPLAVPFTLQATGAAGTSLPGSAVDWTRIAVMMWFAGAVLLSIRHMAGRRVVRGLALRARPLVEPYWTRAYPDIRTAEVGSALTCGLRQTVILVPPEANLWPEAKRRAILMHEVAHIRRGDLWWNLLATAATTLLWFHPLAWVLAARMRREAELACDDAVLGDGVRASSYAELLLESAAPQRNLLACAMSGGRGDLRSRLDHVLDAAVRRRLTRRAAAVATGALLFVLCSILLVRPATAEQVYKVGGDVKAPKLIHQVEPQYSEAARDAHIEGTVVLSVIIGTEGKASGFDVLKSLHPDLDRNAIEAVRQWLFEPGTKNGKPVMVSAKIEINFRLN